VARLMGNCC